MNYTDVGLVKLSWTNLSDTHHTTDLQLQITYA